ncbi:BTB domain-containing protein [Phanerochaete sordida]|uniref:BTB domain-containing protein n=1 Tax=Phanerochaete sordida TaxID=48140 RepID=A0A9P3GMJ5_9APHY|nr:BTB domain-containing protein [Phanerochaete sordida]
MAPGTKPKPKVTVPLRHCFNKPSADVVLRSSDKVDFHVHRAVLSDASSVFEAMFALPQEPSASGEGEPSLPIVPMQENAETLHLLLGVLYPGKGPSIKSPSRASDLLAVADKYAMDGVVAHVRRVLESSGFLDEGYFWVMAVYAIARRHNFTKLAAKAAHASLKHPLLDLSLTGLAAMSAEHYHDLRTFREACVCLFDYYSPGDDEPDESWDMTIEEVWNSVDPDERFNCNRRDFGEDVVLLNLDECDDCRGRLWFRLHLHRLRNAFSKNVSGASLQDSKLVDQTVANIGDCDDCRQKVPMELLEYNRRLGDQLDLELTSMNFWSHVLK